MLGLAWQRDGTHEPRGATRNAMEPRGASWSFMVAEPCGSSWSLADISWGLAGPCKASRSQLGRSRSRRQAHAAGACARGQVSGWPNTLKQVMDCICPLVLHSAKHLVT